MMKSLYALLFLMSAITGVAQEKENTKEVRSAFDVYKNALMNGEGSEAFQFLSSSSVSYYSGLLSKILFAPKEEVKSMSFIDRMTILASRHRVPVAKIKAMEAKDFFIYAIDQGMIGKSSVQGLEIGEITMDGDKAFGRMTTNGIETPVDVEFVKEEQDWKVNIASIYPAVSEMLGQFMTATGQTEDDFMFQMIAMMNGEKPSEEVWQPLLNKQE